MNFTELAKKRFSVRKFSNRKIDSNLLDEILQISLIAPTAKNQQPQRIYVLQSDEAFAKLDKLTRCRYGAATVLLFTYNEDEEWKNPLEQNVHSGVEDVSIVAAYVMLKAAELGLDTTWCNMFENNALEKAFYIPENEKSVLIMPVGYRDAEVNPAPMHEQIKELESMVKYI